MVSHHEQGVAAHVICLRDGFGDKGRDFRTHVLDRSQWLHADRNRRYPQGFSRGEEIGDGALVS